VRRDARGDRKWLTCVDANGRRRIEDPKDFVRLEILSALRRSIPAVPVLVDGTAIPPAEALPQPLQGMSWGRALKLRDSNWDDDVRMLISVLEDSAKREQHSQSHRRAMLAGSIITLAALVILPGLPYRISPAENPLRSPPSVRPAVTLQASSQPVKALALLPDGNLLPLLPMG
jgi:hypothetical protein